MLRFSGEARDCVYAQYLTHLLVQAINRAGKAFPGTRAARTTFRNAMANRICKRMRAIKAEQRTAMSEATTGRALAVVDSKLARIDARFGAQETGNARATYGSAAAIAAGEAAGNQVGFGRPVSGTVARALPARA